MPTEDHSEHDFVVSETLAKAVTLKEFLLGIVNERERKYDQRFAAVDKAIADTSRAVKEALESANQTTKDALSAAYAATRDALNVANSNIAAAQSSVDKRFDSVNEFRQSLADQQELFARKSDVDAAMLAFEKATIKAENATEKRFDSVNEFRLQMSDQQAQYVRKSEVDIQIRALDAKLDTAVAQLQQAKGRESGISAVWGVLVVAISVILSGLGVGAALLAQ